MKSMEYSTLILLVAAFFPIIGGLLHVMIIFGGVSWYEFFYAPPPILESAKDGTWLAPVGTLFVAFLMLLAGGYALSAAGVLFKLPLLKIALITLSFLFIVRGVLLFHLIYWKPEVIDAFRVISSIMFLISGMCFALGTYLRWRQL